MAEHRRRGGRLGVVLLLVVVIVVVSGGAYVLTSRYPSVDGDALAAAVGVFTALSTAAAAVAALLAAGDSSDAARQSFMAAERATDALKRARHPRGTVGFGEAGMYFQLEDHQSPVTQVVLWLRDTSGREFRSAPAPRLKPHNSSPPFDVSGAAGLGQIVDVDEAYGADMSDEIGLGRWRLTYRGAGVPVWRLLDD